MNSYGLKICLFTFCLSLLSVSARSDIVVVVHPDNSIEAISKEESAKIFLGKQKSFVNGRTAVPLDQEEGSSNRDKFYATVTNKTDSQLKSYWSRLIFTGKGHPPRSVSDSNEVKAAINADPNVISYIDAKHVDSSVKVVLQIR